MRVSAKVAGKERATSQERFPTSPFLAITNNAFPEQSHTNKKEKEKITVNSVASPRMFS